MPRAGYMLLWSLCKSLHNHHKFYYYCQSFDFCWNFFCVACVCVCAYEKTPKYIARQIVFDVCCSFQVTVYLENFNKISSSPTFECFWFNCQLMVRVAFAQGQEFEIHFFNVLFLLNTLYLDNSWIFSCSDPTCR